MFSKSPEQNIEPTSNNNGLPVPTGVSAGTAVEGATGDAMLLE